MKIKTAVSGGILLLSVFAHGPALAGSGTEAASPGDFNPEQKELAIASGIDFAKMKFDKGVHIVPLEDSQFVGPLADDMARSILEQKEKGFHTVANVRVRDLRQAVLKSGPDTGGDARTPMRRFASTSDVRPGLLAEPRPIVGTQLESARFVEATTAGGLKEGKWTGLSRVFDVAGLGLVVFDEVDYVASEASITVIEEWINVDVNGHPGIAKTARSEDGRTLVSVAWTTDRFSLSLMLQPTFPDNVESNQQALLAIARDIGD